MHGGIPANEFANELVRKDSAIIFTEPEPGLTVTAIRGAVAEWIAKTHHVHSKQTIRRHICF